MNHWRRSGVLLVLVSFGLGLPLSALAKLAQAHGGDVEFVAVGPGGLKIVGETAELAVEDTDQGLTVKVPLGRLHTGIDLRDRHMKEKYLEVAKYPDAKLSVSRSALKFPADGHQSDGTAQGEVTLHGKKKILPFHYRLSRNGKKLGVSGTVHLDMIQFGINVPSYLGVGVKPEVDVKVKFEAEDT